ncbi:Subtilisin-like protease [Euphorbia peplus]|nr:Subtilisin-like protease [Euphorbia peplus]
MASLVLRYVYLLTIFYHFTSIFSQSSNTYIIHMNLSAMPKAFSDHHNWYLATLSSISNSDHIYSYSNSIHGFSAHLTISQLESLKKSPGYVSSTRDRPLKLHTTHTPQFLGLSSVSGPWPAANYGEDMIIGLVDTGIWPESDSFHDEGMTPVPSKWKGRCVFNTSLCNKKVIGAHFFNKGLLATNPKLKVSASFSPRDTSGHGTHTASIAAGNYVAGANYFGYASGTARGMAPRAKIAMYKAVWKYGVYESDVLAAIDQAIQDGVDVLSLSLALANDATSLDDDPIAIAAFAAMKRGIFVVASAGNDGPEYYTLVNGAPWLVTVGASTIDREFEGVLSLGDGKEISFRTLYPGNYSISQRSLVFLNGCGSVEAVKNVKNKIIVCKDTLSLSDQIKNAEFAGVSGAVFITNMPLSDSEYYTRTSFQAAFIGVEDGTRVLEYTQKSNDPRGILYFRKTIIGTKPAPKVDKYSSRGPFTSCHYVLKPDLIAPGSLVLASWSPMNSVAEVGTHPLFSKFNLVSGTSMAAPHVAGVAALIKKAHPDWSPAAIRSALMTTSTSQDNTQSPIKDAGNNDLQASPLDIGSGHISPLKSLDPGLIYDATEEGYINLLCAMSYTKKQIEMITKYTNPNCVNKSLDVNYPSFIAYFDSGSEGKIEFRRSVTNVGDGVSSYSAKVTGMSGINVTVEPEKLVFKKMNEKVSYKLSLEIEGAKLEEGVVHGSLRWVHDGGKYNVRSPIVVTNLAPESP